MSMTGFGSSSVNTQIGNVQIEVKSVNSRFLDLTVHTMNDRIRSLEADIRGFFSDNPLVKRGKIECRLNVIDGSDQEISVGKFNLDAFNQLLALQKVVRKAIGAKEMTVAEILTFPGILGSGEETDDSFKEAVLAGLEEAVEKLNAAREQEGLKLAQVLLKQADNIEELVGRLKPRIPEIIDGMRQKLTDRLEDALAEQLSSKSALSKEEVNERIRQEVTLYAVRLDVQEEMDRLNTHVANIRETIAAGGAVGRKLDFLIQELNREANTLASKAAAIEMTDTAIGLKLCIEQMREQIQNMQ